MYAPAASHSVSKPRVSAMSSSRSAASVSVEATPGGRSSSSVPNARMAPATTAIASAPSMFRTRNRIHIRLSATRVGTTSSNASAMATPWAQM